jgi:hypothetical protein
VKVTGIGTTVADLVDASGGVKVRAEGFRAFSRRRRKQDGAALANRALLMESPAPIASIPASINSVMTCALSGDENAV